MQQALLARKCDACYNIHSARLRTGILSISPGPPRLPSPILYLVLHHFDSELASQSFAYIERSDRTLLNSATRDTKRASVTYVYVRADRIAKMAPRGRKALGSYVMNTRKLKGAKSEPLCCSCENFSFSDPHNQTPRVQLDWVTRYGPGRDVAPVGEHDRARVEEKPLQERRQHVLTSSCSDQSSRRV